ncbi:MAG: AAA family ATPase [Ruminiclostridium sp.]|nr:AAA family ATPase [Ruminiclostridium sp.]
MNISKNTILYGPPGTGKTYNTVLYAVAIIENKNLSEVKAEEYNDVLSRYNEHKNEGLIEFTTFHQSYGYEEFIEGIKPVKNEDSDESNIQYDVLPGLFKKFCDKAGSPVIRQRYNAAVTNDNPTVWKVSLEGTGDNQTRAECMKNGHIRIAWDGYGESITSDTEFTHGGKNVLNAFIWKMKKGDIVLSCYSATTIDAIGVVTGDYEWHDEYPNYKRVRNVNWLVKNIRQDITEINNGVTMTLSTVYKLNVSVADIMNIVAQNASPLTQVVEKEKNYVFIIDEINRGNISKIFGELITLIEPTKRIGQTEGMKIKLPYSQTMFGVPDNVYILGTMNTADRSIAAIDTALRRRFRFKEIMPDVDVLNGITVEGVIIKNMLDKINKRITALYDREHTIGHSYFLPLKDNPTLDTLAVIFSDDIIPLLQEYFYEDYEKIRLVLGDNKKSVDDTNRFIIATQNDYNELFGNTEGFDDSFSYEINNEAFYNIEAYRKI